MDEFRTLIYNWFKENKRDLPWRQTTDPYKIWISEIILQQTRVTQGMNYYLRFIENFPDVKSLAQSSENKVLKTWQGLGYYSRARNLHHTAQTILEKNNGVFPNSFEEISKLKGVGPYTAAAIASIAFNLPYPAIDGNVYRLFSRYFGISKSIDSSAGKKEIQLIANELMSTNNTGFHNQALMEFGAMQCVPKSPKCNICPLQQTCFAAQNKKVDSLPVKSKKSQQRIRYFYYYFIENRETVFIEKRMKNDIWKNLYQFPLYESDKMLPENKILNSNNISFFSSNCKINIKKLTAEKKHVLSHQIIYARLIHTEIDKPECLKGDFIQVEKKDIYKFAMPRLLEQFLNNLNL